MWQLPMGGKARGNFFPTREKNISFHLIVRQTFLLVPEYLGGTNFMYLNFLFSRYCYIVTKIQNMELIIYQ